MVSTRNPKTMTEPERRQDAWELFKLIQTTASQTSPERGREWAEFYMDYLFAGGEPKVKCGRDLPARPGAAKMCRMQLDSPPMFEHLLLESPWAVMVVCVVAAAMLFSAGRRRKSRGIQAGGLAALALAVSVFMLAKGVTTARERLILDTEALVAATAPLDNAALDRLLDPSAVVTGPDTAVWLNAVQLRPRLNQVAQRFGIGDQQVRTVEAFARDETWGESAVTVRTEAGGAGPVNTGWRLTWRRDDAGDDSGGGSGDGSGGGGGWRVVEIRWMRFNGLEVQQGMMP